MRAGYADGEEPVLGPGTGRLEGDAARGRVQVEPAGVGLATAQRERPGRHGAQHPDRHQRALPEPRRRRRRHPAAAARQQDPQRSGVAVPRRPAGTVFPSDFQPAVDAYGHASLSAPSC